MHYALKAAAGPSCVSGLVSLPPFLNVTSLTASIQAIKLDAPQYCDAAFPSVELAVKYEYVACRTESCRYMHLRSVSIRAFLQLR